MAPNLEENRINPSKSGKVAEAILGDCDGTMVRDSGAWWNTVGMRTQECLLHHFRDMYRTLDRNKTHEFRAMFDGLRSVPKDAIAPRAEYGQGMPRFMVCGLQDGWTSSPNSSRGKRTTTGTSSASGGRPKTC